MVFEFDSDPAPPSPRAAQLAADPQTPRWARDCGWVPGTGHCQNRGCDEGCIFRAQRETELARVVRARRERRPSHRGFAARVARLAAMLRPRR